MAEFQIVEKQGLKMIRTTIENETVKAEAGALHYMRGDIEIEVEYPSRRGLIGAIFSQESAVKPTYTGTGEIYFGPPTFGQYHKLHLQSEAWILDRGAYVCSDLGVEIAIHKNKVVAGLAGGEGLYQVRVAGSGCVVIQAPGPIETIDLQEERLAVDGTFAVAREERLKYTVQKAAKGLVRSLVSGEGYLNVIEGTGRVMIAPVPNFQVSLVDSVVHPIRDLVHQLNSHKRQS